MVLFQIVRVPVEEWLTGIESVTKEEIVKVAKKKNIEIFRYKIYFLHGNGGRINGEKKIGL